MKRAILISACSILFSIAAFSQNAPDRFGNISEMAGSDIILYNAEAMRTTSGPFLFAESNGKCTAIKDEQVYNSMTHEAFHVNGIKEVGKKSYLAAEIQNRSLLMLTGEGYDYLAGARSVTYWDNLLSEIKDKYNYIEAGSNLAGRNIEAKYILPGNYIEVHWQRLRFPATISDPVLFVYDVVGNNLVATWEDINEHSNDFYSSAKYEELASTLSEQSAVEAGDYESRSGITDRTKVIEAIIPNTYDNRALLSKAGISVKSDEEPLKMSVYASVSGASHNNRSYKGFVLGKDVVIPASGLRFKSDSDKDYIDERGTVGSDTRKEVAQLNDEQYKVEYLDARMKAEKRLREQQERQIALYEKNQILLMSQETISNGYRLGIRFELYNCFKQEIKHVELRIVAFNDSGKTQKDDLGEFAKDVRCNGPLTLRETGVYEFDRLFWDDGRDIKEMRLVEVKVTLKNGSVITWTGKENVDKHRATQQ